METKIKILLSSEYEQPLAIHVTGIVSGKSVFITDIQLDENSNLNDFLDFISIAAKKQIQTAYKVASVTCGKEKETAESAAKKYTDSVISLYQVIERKFIDNL